MKKLLLTAVIAACSATFALAQGHTTVVENKTTTKKTSTVPQKVHNTFSKKKHYSGKKTTHTVVTEQKTK